MPLNEEGKVNFTTTLFALIRENLSIKMRPAEEMDQADKELRITIKKLWPLQAPKIVDKLIPPGDGNNFLILFFVMIFRTSKRCLFAELGLQKMTVGKVYGGMLILESWKTTRFGQVETCTGLVVSVLCRPIKHIIYIYIYIYYIITFREIFNPVVSLIVAETKLAMNASNVKLLIYCSRCCHDLSSSSSGGMPAVGRPVLLVHSIYTLIYTYITCHWEILKQKKLVSAKS